MKKLNALYIGCTLAMAGFLPAAHAANMSKDVYHTQKSTIENTYKMEHKACGDLGGNAKDICVEKAKGKENVAKAELEYQFSGKQSDRVAAQKARIKADFEVAKEMCDDTSGHAKDVCTTQAKAEHEKSLAALSLQKDVQNAQKDASEQVREADYKVAAEKCDVYSGDAKSNCIIAAKKFYGMN